MKTEICDSGTVQPYGVCRTAVSAIELPNVVVVVDATLPRGRASAHGPSGGGGGAEKVQAQLPTPSPWACVRPWWAEQVVVVEISGGDDSINNPRVLVVERIQ